MYGVNTTLILKNKGGNKAMALYAEKLMKFALSQVGTKEKPAGSNKVKYNTWFYGREVSGNSYPWCCAYVCYCFHHVGFKSLFYGGKKSASCATVEDYYESRKQIVNKNDGRFGDIAFFNFGSGRTRHIGFIICKNPDGSYKTAEGNTSVASDDNGGCVMIRTRYKSQISSIARPKYTMHKAVKVTGSTHKYADMSVKSKSHGKLTSDSKVRFVKDMENGWSKIISLADGEISYVKNKYLDKEKLSEFKSATVKTAGVLRKNNKMKAAALIKNVPAGASIKVISKGKHWTNCIINGKNGYFATKKIKF